jgi:hypothetical protein
MSATGSAQQTAPMPRTFRRRAQASLWMMRSKRFQLYNPQIAADYR